MNEEGVQNLLYSYRIKHAVAIPNCGMIFGWESDFISVTKSFLAHDHEIKVSRADWLSELRKINADRGAGGYTNPKQHRSDMLKHAKRISAMVIEGQHVKDIHLPGRSSDWPSYHHEPPPNYFWMVTTRNVIKYGELPAYAGHIVVRFIDGKYRLVEIKPAPRLHRVKIFNHQLVALARGLSLRYWKTRGVHISGN